MGDNIWPKLKQPLAQPLLLDFVEEEIRKFPVLENSAQEIVDLSPFRLAFLQLVMLRLKPA